MRAHVQQKYYCMILTCSSRTMWLRKIWKHFDSIFDKYFIKINFRRFYWVVIFNKFDKFWEAFEKLWQCTSQLLEVAVSTEFLSAIAPTTIFRNAVSYTCPMGDYVGGSCPGWNFSGGSCLLGGSFRWMATALVAVLRRLPFKVTIMSFEVAIMSIKAAIAQVAVVLIRV